MCRFAVFSGTFSVSRDLPTLGSPPTIDVPLTNAPNWKVVGRPCLSKVVPRNAPLATTPPGLRIDQTLSSKSVAASPLLSAGLVLKPGLGRRLMLVAHHDRVKQSPAGFSFTYSKPTMKCPRPPPKPVPAAPDTW